MKKYVSLLIVLLMVITCVCGCSGGATSGAGSDEAEASARTDVIIGQQGEPNSLDPHGTGSGRSIVVVKQMFESLLHLNADGTIVGCLAKDYTVSDDGLVYTYNLRDDVNFQNGDHMTAEDVKYSIDRACESPYCDESTGNIINTEAVDDYTFKITLDKPFALLTQFMATTYLAIVNKNVVEEQGDQFGVNPGLAGTGPYIFKEWQSGTSITLERNENYWGEKPYMTKVVYKKIAEQNSGDLAVEAGDIDAYLNPALADVPRFQEDENLAVYMTPSFYIDYFTFNVTVAPFDNLMVRQAINKCINRDDIVSASFNNISGIPAGSFISTALVGHSDDFPVEQVDLEDAKRLLTEAGYPDGFTFTITCTDGRMKSSAQIIQAAVAQIGLTAEIEVLESNAFYEVTGKGDFETACEGMSSSVPDAYSLMSCVFESSWIDLWNSARYSNPEVDALFEESNSITDVAGRTEIFNKIQTIVLEDLPYLPLAFSQQINVVNANLKGWVMHPGNTPYVTDLSW